LEIQRNNEMEKIPMILDLDYKQDRIAIIEATIERFRVYGMCEICHCCRKKCKMPSVPGVAFSCYVCNPLEKEVNGGRRERETIGTKDGGAGRHEI